MAEKEYIFRDAAIAVLCDACGNAACPKGKIHRCSYFYRMQEIPAADVRPVVRGKWIKNGWSIRCSECGYDMPFSVRNFCPNCGAWMEES